MTAPLLVDGQALQGTSAGRGIGRWLRGLLAGLTRVRPDWPLEVVVAPDLPPVAPRSVPTGVSVVTAPARAGTRRARARRYGEWLTARRPRAVLLGSVFELERALVPTFGSARSPVLAVAYDIIPLMFPELYLSDRRSRVAYGRGLSTFLAADRLLAISACTAADLTLVLDVPRGRVVEVGGGIAPSFLEEAPPRTPTPGAPGALLVVGAEDPRKCAATAVRAFAALPADTRASLELRIVGPVTATQRAALAELAGDDAHRLRFLGRVSDERLRDLYRDCRALLFPSHYEGLGLPPLEAFACGAPVVAYRASSIPEIVGQLAWLAEPDGGEAEFARALRGALCEPRDARRDARRLHAAAWTWERAAERAARAIESAEVGPSLALGPFALMSRLRAGPAMAGAVPTIDERRALARYHAARVLAEAALPVPEVVHGPAGRARRLARELRGAWHRSREAAKAGTAPRARDDAPAMVTSPQAATPPTAPPPLPARLSLGASAPYVFGSEPCRAAHYELPLFGYWCGQLGEAPRHHRKLWEYVYIVHVLHERGLLGPGRRGLGFAVGQEPLPALFARLGVDVTATDLGVDQAAAAGWVETRQHAAGLEGLDPRGLCDPEVLRARVSFRTVDMASVPADLAGFDFCWSACAIEHLGSLDAGVQFVERSLMCLRPGGVAVHTTELNISSDEVTHEAGGTVVYRRRDLLELADRLRGAGHDVAPLRLEIGDDPIERWVDVPPYRAEPHLRIDLAGVVCTSVGLIVVRGR